MNNLPLNKNIINIINNYLLISLNSVKYNKNCYINHLNNLDKTYYIHDNGGRPFGVNMNNNISIFSNYKKYKHIFTFKPIEIFIGKSPKNKMTLFSGGYGEKFDGNSILLRIKELEYVLIGSEIIRFNSLFLIKEFISPVGNNDVP